MIPDPETRKLDLEILKFIRESSKKIPPEGAFEALALKLFAYQFSRNAHYRKFCLRDGKIPGRLRYWKEIPAIPAAGFKELVLSGFPLKNTVKVFKTSGTTQGQKGVHFFDTLKLYEAAVVPSFEKYLLPDTQNLFFAYLIRSPKEAPQSSLSHMVGVIERVFAKGRGSFYIRRGEACFALLARDLQNCRRKVLLLATAFSLKGFLDYLESEKIRLKLFPGSRLMETGGFKGRSNAVSKDRLRALCEKFLGVKSSFCVGEYGMTELSSQFYDTSLRNRVLKKKHRSFLAGPPWVRTVVMDPQTGREAGRGTAGLLCHYDLANRGSVMAVQTEDLGRVSGEGFELLGRAKDSELRGCSLNYEEFVGDESVNA
jgi:hypothetical protein